MVCIFIIILGLSKSAAELIYSATERKRWRFRHALGSNVEACNFIATQRLLWWGQFWRRNTKHICMANIFCVLLFLRTAAAVCHQLAACQLALGLLVTDAWTHANLSHNPW